MRTAIAAIALSLSLSAANAKEWTVAVECPHQMPIVTNTCASKTTCMAWASRQFDALTDSDRHDCEVNLSRQ